MKEVVFTEDYANKKKGDVFKCSPSLASQLINVEKVAILAESKSKKAKKEE